MKSLYFIMLIIMSSCASYVNEMHRNFDKQDTRKYKRPTTHDKFDMYRNNGNQFDSPTTRNKSTLPPVTRRNYEPEENVRKRYNAESLLDNGNRASLWGNDDNAQFLFTQSTEKKTGEIIIINVNTSLKNDITAELKRAFPDRIIAPPQKVEGTAGDSKEKVAKVAKPAPKGEGEGGNQTVHDRISSVIIEKINKNHLLLKGRKTILYKKRKRTIEIQVLISKKHISGEDTVESDNVLESSVRVVR